jgi:regulator of nucleoside diphosphate kinase
MNSTVSLRDLGTNEVETYTLVFPECADIANNKLSVLAPIGTAVLGYRVGDEFRWRVPEGWRKLKIEQVIFQPERDGALRI